MASTNNHALYGAFSDHLKAWIATNDVAAIEAAARLPITERRKLMQAGEESESDPFPGVTFQDMEIWDGVTARVFTPATSTSADRRPLVLVYHGGGWVMGGHLTEYSIVRTLVGKLDCVAVSIGYRLAPENPFPAPFDDCFRGLEWARSNAAKFGGDPDFVLVAGSSSGGNLAAAVAMRAQMEGLTAIKGQILASPATCHYRHYDAARVKGYELDSMDQLADAPILSRTTMKGFWGDLRDLPPTYIQVSGADALRDDGLAFANGLESAGVSVRMDVYPGVPHGYQVPYLRFPDWKIAERDLETHTRWLITLASG